MVVQVLPAPGVNGGRRTHTPGDRKLHTLGKPPRRRRSDGSGGLAGGSRRRSRRCSLVEGTLCGDGPGGRRALLCRMGFRDAGSRRSVGPASSIEPVSADVRIRSSDRPRSSPLGSMRSGEGRGDVWLRGDHAVRVAAADTRGGRAGTRGSRRREPALHRGQARRRRRSRRDSDGPGSCGGGRDSACHRGVIGAMCAGPIDPFEILGGMQEEGGALSRLDEAPRVRSGFSCEFGCGARWGAGMRHPLPVAPRLSQGCQLPRLPAALWRKARGEPAARWRAPARGVHHAEEARP